MLRGLDGFFDTQSVYANCAVLRVRRGLVSQDFGGHSEGETPLPIPNRVVKPLSADGTWPARARESRTPPVLLHEPPIGRLVVVKRRPAVVRGRSRRNRHRARMNDRSGAMDRRPRPLSATPRSL